MRNTQKFFKRYSLIWVLILTTSFLTLISGCTSSPNKIEQINDLKTGQKLFNENLNLRNVPLGPEDVKDVFLESSFSIIQNLKDSRRYGIYALYPLEQLEHTSAFSKGYSTQIEIFRDITTASTSMDDFISEQMKKNLVSLQVENIGNKTVAYKGSIVTSSGEILDGNEYSIMILKKNLLVLIIFRTNGDISPTKLSEFGTLVLSRIEKLN